MVEKWSWSVWISDGWTMRRVGMHRRKEGGCWFAMAKVSGIVCLFVHCLHRAGLSF